MSCRDCEIYQNAIPINPLYPGQRYCWMNKNVTGVNGNDPGCWMFRKGDNVEKPITFSTISYETDYGDSKI